MEHFQGSGKFDFLPLRNGRPRYRGRPKYTELPRTVISVSQLFWRHVGLIGRASGCCRSVAGRVDLRRPREGSSGLSNFELTRATSYPFEGYWFPA